MFDKGNVCIFMREVFDVLNASVRIERRRKTVPAICLSRAPGTTFDVAGRRETGLKEGGQFINQSCGLARNAPFLPFY